MRVSGIIYIYCITRTAPTISGAPIRFHSICRLTGLPYPSNLITHPTRDGTCP
jgi:hypothetical protein